MMKTEIAALLRAIADVIERNSPTEIAAVTAALTGTAERSQKGRLASKKSTPAPLSEITKALLEFSDRDEALRFLAERSLNKKELTALARSNNVHVVKEDNVEKIVSRIVEALVGSRLNSLAIRGEAASGK